jgi:hypothetical protein
VISATTNADAKQFDFLEGEWSAVCRFPLNDGSWGESPGSLKASKVLDGCVFLEYFDGPYLGTIMAPRLQSANVPVGNNLDGHICARWFPGLARAIRRWRH